MREKDDERAEAEAGNGKGRLCGASLQSVFPNPSPFSGENRLAILQPGQGFVTSLRRERVVLRLEPGKFCLQITDALLETAHFRDHPRVRTADVAE